MRNIRVKDITKTDPLIIQRLYNHPENQIREIYLRLAVRLGLPYEEAKKALCHPDLPQTKKSYVELICGLVGATIGQEPQLELPLMAYLISLLKY